MMGGRPRLDQFRPVFPECFSGRENPWKMSASWFLIEVASPEESGFSLETRCQGTCSRDLPRTSAGCLEPSGQCLRGGLCTEQVFIHFKKRGYGTEQSCSPPPHSHPSQRNPEDLFPFLTSLHAWLWASRWNASSSLAGRVAGGIIFLVFSFQGRQRAQGPGWPLEWALFYTSGNFIEQSTLPSQRVSH